MKHYEKPMLTALSLNGNEQLCGYCADQGYKTVADFTPDQVWAIETMVGGNMDGKISRTEFGNLFVNAADSCEDLVDIGSYCKFTSTESGYTQVAFS